MACPARWTRVEAPDQHPGETPQFTEHYPSWNEYRSSMQVVETAQGNWSNYGLEIVDFWTDGTDFYFSAGKAPSDPPDLFPNIAVLYSDVVLYTQQPPVAAEPTTWGRIKRLR